MPNIIQGETDEIIDNEIIEDDDTGTMPEIVEKEIIMPEEVFKKKDILMKKELNDQIVPVLKKAKQRRKMTAEGLEKLAINRIKAVETRKKNAALRREGKLPPKPTKKQKEEAEKQQKVEDMRPVVNNIVHEHKNITNTITHDDIQRIALEATQKALIGYEEVRKFNKTEKKKKKAVENHQKDIQDKIKAATARREFDRNSIFYGY